MGGQKWYIMVYYESKNQLQSASQLLHQIPNVAEDVKNRQAQQEPKIASQFSKHLC